MIFYFTGTGNSQHVATRIGELLGDSHIKHIAEYYDDVLNCKDFFINVDADEPLGFVCPVHSWGIAKSMKRFLKKTKINYQGNKIFAILVCGDNCGKAREQLQETLWKRSHLRCDLSAPSRCPTHIS